MSKLLFLIYIDGICLELFNYKMDKLFQVNCLSLFLFLFNGRRSMIKFCCSILKIKGIVKKCVDFPSLLSFYYSTVSL